MSLNSRVRPALCAGVVLLVLAGWLTPDSPRLSAQSTLFVTLRSPRTATVFGAPASVPLAADVPAGVTPRQVDFYVDGQLVATDTSRPYAATWAGVAAGPHTVAAVVRTPTASATSAPAVIALRSPAEQGLLQPSSLVYEGAFRLPHDTINGSRFGYGGGAMGYHAANDSLYLLGHEQHNKAAEIAIPEVRRAATYEGHAVATRLQPFFDPVDGKRSSVAPGLPGIMIGGMLPYGGKLHTTAYVSYDAMGAQQVSHFASGLNLSVSNDTLGPVEVDAPMAGYVSGYMATVPKAWQAEFGGPALTGQCCLNIVGRTSNGPAAFAFDPAAFGFASPIPSSPLVYYPSTRPLATWNTQNPYFNGTTRIPGMAFPEGTRTVLFFGSHGTGPFCYGTGAECGDTQYSYKGNHAAPYVYRVWAYDARDLAAVRAGAREPWTVRPYAYWDLAIPFKTGEFGLRGVAYDPGTARIYLSQARGEQTLVHAYRVVVVTQDRPNQQLR